MIKVLKEEQVPRAEITCSNCGSLLEYGNADLYERHDYIYGTTGIANHYFVCPVCGVEVNASWVVKE